MSRANATYQTQRAQLFTTLLEADLRQDKKGGFAFLTGVIMKNILEGSVSLKLYLMS